MTLLAVVEYLSIPSDIIHGGSKLQHREQVLRDDLLALRDVLAQFRQNRGRPPESLDELVAEGYLRKIPTDPFARSPNLWQVERDQTGGDIQIRSTSDAVSSLKSRYSDW